MQSKQLDHLQVEAGMQFIQIPGPNPILVPGEGDDWDAHVIESCNVLKDGTRGSMGNTYYLYYHGIPLDEERWPRKTYRLGVATAPHPLGPWTKYEGNPIIDLGSEGSWEDEWVACAAVLKEEDDKYYMWYSGNGHVGLATASSPVGPWEKYEGNPVLEDFGYLGAVVKVDDKYYMYNEYPISDSSPDSGPFCLATADTPEGRWTKWVGNPVRSAGDPGMGVDGGFSESGVLYHDGMFHTFYSGVKWTKLESIGYAYSLDGYNFIKYSGNPVASRERNPDAEAFAEAHALYEPPFVYVYHTLRYISTGGKGEDLGVQVLATTTPFRLPMPVLNLDSLAAGATSPLAACPPISCEHISELAITAGCGYNSNVDAGLRLHLRASCDGMNYDTEDLCAFDMPLAAGQTVSKTVEFSPKVMFVKVLAENLSEAYDISDIKVTATLGHS